MIEHGVEGAMFQIITALFGVLVVGGAAVLAYAIYLTSGFGEAERRNIIIPHKQECRSIPGTSWRAFL